MMQKNMKNNVCVYVCVCIYICVCVCVCVCVCKTITLLYSRKNDITL